MYIGNTCYRDYIIFRAWSLGKALILKIMIQFSHSLPLPPVCLQETGVDVAGQNEQEQNFRVLEVCGVLWGKAVQ